MELQEVYYHSIYLLANTGQKGHFSNKKFCWYLPKEYFGNITEKIKYRCLKPVPSFLLPTHQPILHAWLFLISTVLFKDYLKSKLNLFIPTCNLQFLFIQSKVSLLILQMQFKNSHGCRSVKLARFNHKHKTSLFTLLNLIKLLVMKLPDDSV